MPGWLLHRRGYVRILLAEIKQKILRAIMPFPFRLTEVIKMVNCIKTIRLFQDIHYPNPDIMVDKTLFKAQSYSASAFDELIRYIKKNDSKNLIEAIEEFRYKMDSFAAYAKTEDVNFMFSCMYDAMTDFLDYIIAIRED